MRSLIAFAIFVAVLVGPVGVQGAAVPEPERVVGTGDSILALSAGQLVSADRWWDLEQGRQVDIRGNMGRYTTAEMLPILFAKSRPGGWVVVQDNAAQTTLTRWREMLRQYVATIPDDRCLLGVLPVFDAAVDPVAASFAQSAANVMVQEFNVQPCHEYIRWNQAVQANPALTYDGQHPSAAGVAWLARTIDDTVGFRG